MHVVCGSACTTNMDMLIILDLESERIVNTPLLRPDVCKKKVIYKQLPGNDAIRKILNPKPEMGRKLN